MHQTAPSRINPWVKQFLTVTAAIIGILSFFFSPAGGWGQKDAARRTVSLLHSKLLSLGIAMYAADHDDSMPVAAAWASSILPYCRPSYDGISVYRDPMLPPDTSQYWNERNDSFQLDTVIANARWGYAFDSRLSTARASKIPQPRNRIEIYQSANLAWNATDAFTSYREMPIHRVNISFADTHSKSVPSEKLRRGLDYVPE